MFASQFLEDSRRWGRQKVEMTSKAKHTNPVWFVVFAPFVSFKLHWHGAKTAPSTTKVETVSSVAHSLFHLDSL